jgi:hypothetical protein
MEMSDNEIYAQSATGPKGSAFDFVAGVLVIISVIVGFTLLLLGVH